MMNKLNNLSYMLNTLDGSHLDSITRFVQEQHLSKKLMPLSGCPYIYELDGSYRRLSKLILCGYAAKEFTVKDRHINQPSTTERYGF